MRHLAEEIQRGEQRKDSSSRGTAAAPVPKLAASTSHESRENSIEPDLNPKKRLLIHLASSAASGGGQHRVKRSATDAEPEAQIGVPMEMGIGESAALPSALTANTRRIFFRSQLQWQSPRKGEFTGTVKKQ